MMTLAKARQILMKGKMKGQVDIIYLTAFFFVASIVIALTLVIWSDLTTSGPVEQLFNSTPTGHNAQVQATSSLHIFANAIVFIFIFAAIASMIAAAFANSAPAFAILGIIVLPIEIVFSFLFHDFFLTVISNSAFAGIISQIPSIIMGFTYLPVICLVISVIAIIVTFIKP
jgi:hypothetical protein